MFDRTTECRSRDHQRLGEGKNFIPNTISKSFVFTITKSIGLLHPPNLIIVRFTILMIGKAKEFMAFVLHASFSQRRFNCLASVSIMKLWVALTMVLLIGFWLIQVSTYIIPFSIGRFVSPTFFWRDDTNFKAQILELSPSSVWVTSPSTWLALSSESKVQEA